MRAHHRATPPPGRPPRGTCRSGWRPLPHRLASGLLAAVLATASALPAAAQNRGGRAPVTVNFVNAEVDAVSRAFAAMMGKPIVVDPRVRGQVTVYSDQPMSVEQAWQMYLSSLRGLGFAVVESGGLLKVVPEADARLQTGSLSVDRGAAARAGQIATQIFTLRHENANNLVPVLRPLISANNTINVNPGTNALVITDYADNLQRIARIVSALDQPSSTDFEVVPLQHAVAIDIAPLVQRLADSGSAAGTPGVPGVAGAAGGSAQVLPDPRSNSLIIKAANGAKLNQLRDAIRRLDRPMEGAGGMGNIWVVYLKHADATRLATILRASFASGASVGGSGGPAPGQQQGLGNFLGTSGGLQGQGIQGQQGQNTGGLAGGNAAATAPVGAVGQPSTGGGIQADPSTNSLIITAPEPLYRRIRAVIEQLDTRRAQIYVESLIVQVDAQRLADFGVQWQNMFGNKGDRTLVGAGTNFTTSSGSNPAGNILNLSAAAVGGRSTAANALGQISEGFNIGILRKVADFYTVGALAKFLEANVGANVLSTPNLVALDNEEAKIVIGQNVPFITGSFTNTGSGGASVNPFQTIERKDVGLTLRVKSQIGEGGTVRMTIYQENSTVRADSSAGLITDKSAIETSVVVDDGAIMVLGGLMKDEYTDTRDKVPGIGDVPFVGNLFKSEGRRRVKTNLLVFLRPVVMRDSVAADALTTDRYESIRAVQRDTQPTATMVLPIGDAPILPPKPQGTGLPQVRPSGVADPVETRPAVQPAPVRRAPIAPTDPSQAGG